MANPKNTLAALSPIYLPQFSDVSLAGGRESFRALGKLAHEFLNALPTPVEELKSKLSRGIWIAHADYANTHFPAALAASRQSVVGFTEPEKLLARLKHETPDLILISTAFQDLISFVHDHHPDIPLILSSADDITASMNDLQSRPRLNHMIFEHSFDSVFLQRNLLSTSEKIISGDIFGIEKYLDAGAPIAEASITGNESRSRALETLATDLSRTGLSMTLARKAHHLADELLMNAIYDAPVDKVSGKPRYNHLTRSVSVELEPAEYARLRYGFDGSILALSIDDPFGALPRDIILKYLKSCYEGQFGKLNETEGKGGGGMGLYQIMSSADLLVSNISPGTRTEIIALINVQERLPVRTHSFHYFTSPKLTVEAKTPEDKARVEYLPAIIEHLQALCERPDPSSIKAIKNLSKQIGKLSKSSGAKLPLEESVILISANKRHQRTFRSIAGASHVTIHIFETMDQIVGEIDPFLIAVDDTICDAVPHLHILFPQAKIVAFSDRDSLAAIDELRKYPVLRQVFTLDLPKPVLHKLLLTHLSRIVWDETFGIQSYLAFGATIKKLEPQTLRSAPRAPEELQKLQTLYASLMAMKKAKSAVYGFDPHVFALSIQWSESITRDEILDQLQPNSSNVALSLIYAHAHAIIISSNGQDNELTLLRFQSTEDIPEPFLYTFFA